MKVNEMFSYYVQDYFINYLPNIRNCSRNTINTYRNVFIDLIKFLKVNNIDVNKVLMKDINIDYINNYLKYIKEKNNSSNTINTKISALKSFFNYLEFKTINYIETCSQINKIRIKNNKNNIPKYLTQEEINIILNYKNSKISLKESVIFILMYYGALRVSELCNLKRDDIEFLDKKNIRLQIINSKNNKSRIITFECNYSNYIKKYISNNKNATFLFINKFGKQYTRKGISYILNKIYSLVLNDNKNKLLFKDKHINPHMLRHSRAMEMLKNGNSLSEIKQFLGHEYIATTEIYARLDADVIKDSLIKHADNINYIKKYSEEEIRNLENLLKSL